MEEIWKEWEYDDITYKVSNLGRIIGAKGDVLKQRLNKDGYKTVTIGNYKRRRSMTMHRIVAIVFIPNPEELLEVNHIDFDRTNNRIDNLEWKSHYDNVKHSADVGRYAIRDFYGENNPNYGNDTLKKKYAENPELAKINNSRKGKQNGRCRNIYLYDLNMNLLRCFDYIGECCEYLIHSRISKSKSVDSLRDRISRIAKSNGEYRGYILSFNKVN